MKVEEMPSAKRPEPWIKQSACCDVFIIEKKHRLSKWIDKFVNSYLTRLALLRRMRSGLLFCDECDPVCSSAGRVLGQRSLWSSYCTQSSTLGHTGRPRDRCGSWLRREVVSCLWRVDWRLQWGQ